MGISGGLLPCPSALVLMLSAIALHRVGAGLALVAAFSVGLSGVLIGLGLLLVFSGRLLAQARPLAGGARLPHLATQYAPIMGALIVVVTGLLVTSETLTQLL